MGSGSARLSSVGATVVVVANALELARKPVEATLLNTVPSALQALLEGEGIPESVQVVNGNLLVQLAPNNTAQPPANLYNVFYHSDGNQQYTETWTVTPSATPLKLRDDATYLVIGGLGAIGLEAVFEDSDHGLLGGHHCCSPR